MRNLRMVKVTAFFATLAGIFVVSCVPTSVKNGADSPIKNVAVVETEIDLQSEVSAEITPAEVRVITAELRKETVKNLPRSKYNVMTSETVRAQSGAVLAKCVDENCIIALGSKIGADYIVRGVISKFQDKFTLSVEMYDTEDGNLVASSETIREENVETLLEKATGVFANMYKTFTDQFSKPSVAPSPQSQPTHIPQQPTPKPMPMPMPAHFTDNRDGKTYKTVAIGSARWMAENLNYLPQTGNSWCYDNDNLNCNKYGRLYDWNTATAACPAGWHLSSREEWDNLVNMAGGGAAGKKLKSTANWKSNGNGTDDYEFSALPGGSYNNGDFNYVDSYGNWWTADAFRSGGYAYFRRMYYFDDNISDDNFSNVYGLSVRCVQD